MRFTILAPTLALAVVLLHGAVPHEGLHELLAATLSQQLAPTDTLNAQCQEADLSVTSQQRTAILLACGPRYTPTPLADLIEGVPLCTDHDKTRWHPLVKRDNSGKIVCTYGHEHHDDPHAVDDIFGPPSASWGGSQELSYPWQTQGAAGPENDAKHEGYKYFVYRDMPCVPVNPGEGCIVAWRVQVHNRGDAADAVVRFHSFSAEYLVQAPGGRRGIGRYVGHLDAGHLALHVNPSGFLCPPLPTNPGGFRCGNDLVRRHSSADVPSPYTPYDTEIAGWYATPLAVFFEEWGPIDYANPSHQLFFGPSRNNSRARVSNLSVNATYPWFDGKFASDGTLTLKGYYDRGNGAWPKQPSPSCSSPSIDCWPFSFERVPYQTYGMSSPPGSPLEAMHEHDVASPATGNSLIRFPN